VAKIQHVPEFKTKNNGRRPIRSTMNAKKMASIQFVVPIMPLSLFWNWGSVMPASSSILLCQVIIVHNDKETW
jgi:hypothetical protein